MKIFRWAPGIFAAALSLACSSVPPPQASWDREADFSSLKTYGWYADPAEDKTVGSAIVDTRFVEDHVKKNVTAELEKKGFRPAGDAEPDFFVDYHTRSAGIISRDQYGAYSWWAMPTYTGSMTVKQVILAVDFRDRAKKLIWRGWATKEVGSSPEKIAKQIRSAIDQILEKFPPPKTS